MSVHGATDDAIADPVLSGTRVTLLWRRRFNARTTAAGPTGRYSAVMSSFFDFEMNDINGESVAFDKFRDQVSLVVNVASK